MLKSLFNSWDFWVFMKEESDSLVIKSTEIDHTLEIRSQKS